MVIGNFKNKNKKSATTEFEPLMNGNGNGINNNSKENIKTHKKK